jgi:hypothetical protein
MIDDGECGAIGGMKIDTRRKPAPAPPCPLQILHDQTWARTRVAAVGSHWLTAWAMARSFLQNLAVVPEDFIIFIFFLGHICTV